VAALAGLGREALYDTVIGAGLVCVDEALEAERVRCAASRYEHLADRQALRAGHVASSLGAGRGRRVAVSGRGRAVLKVANSGCRAGGNGAHAIHWTSAPWSRWCWGYRRAATRVR